MALAGFFFMMSEPEDLPTDPVALARLFVVGRSLKRGDMIQMVRGLLALLDLPAPSLDVPKPPDAFQMLCDARNDGAIPAGVPNVTGYDAKPPIAVQAGVSGSVFLGPEANRYFTRTEAIALAGAIARTALGRVHGEL